MTLLELVIVLPLVFSFVLLFIKKENIVLLKQVALLASFLIFALSIFLWVLFDSIYVGFQFNSERLVLQSMNIYYCLGIDGISLYFILLTTLLIPICILCSWTTIKYRIKEFLIILFVLEFMLLNVFSVLDLLLFYVFFEAVLIPMFMIIGIWGSRAWKIHAAYQFFFYTLIGSVMMLLGIILIYFETGSTNIYVLTSSSYSEIREIMIWLGFFCSFAVKVPMVPVHIWLPEAHVEAPTAGSVILAGILLKMGTYGLLRFSLPMFPYGTDYFTPLVFVVSVIGIIYASCTTIRQIDMKKIIAYSSVGHMNYVTIGIMSQNVQGIEGSIYLMLGHGVVSSALFLCVGLLYERYKTRMINYYGGLAFFMPIFAVCFLIFTLANIGLPSLSNFVGEFLIMMGIINVNFIIGILAMVGVILGAVYSIWLYNRVMFGLVKSNNFSYSDINYWEFIYLFILIVLSLIMGCKPSLFLDNIHISVYKLLSR